ncbi:Hypothetical_protein [Hexamita inflata]|uniref:Hypothetical_protein n=1 Tax=Hexamita inflata TaxID=28002 RepID=A0AA86PKZ4_9EUKA|nr:Hypothetical protein HINF_LOCUS29299 [Hexamita inflata]
MKRLCDQANCSQFQSNIYISTVSLSQLKTIQQQQQINQISIKELVIKCAGTNYKNILFYLLQSQPEILDYFPFQTLVSSQFISFYSSFGEDGFQLLVNAQLFLKHKSKYIQLSGEQYHVVPVYNPDHFYLTDVFKYSYGRWNCFFLFTM